jgi:hypothetical protein
MCQRSKLKAQAIATPINAITKGMKAMTGGMIGALVRVG